MTFLIDAQLPPAMAQWLCNAGHSAKHVEDLKMRQADDGDIWRHALKTGAIIVTKDEDFATRAPTPMLHPSLFGCVWVMRPIVSCLRCSIHAGQVFCYCLNRAIV